MKNSFVLYTEYAKHLSLLSMEQRGVLFTAIMAYETGEELPEMDGITQMAFSFISEQLSRDKDKYETTCKRRSEAGRQGGRPREQKEEEQEEKQEDSCADEEKQMLSEESKKSKCFSEKANESNEKQTKAKKPDNEDDDEYEDDNENEDEREILSLGSSLSPRAKNSPCEVDLSVPYGKALQGFLSEHPNVIVDNCSSSSLDLDYSSISREFSASSWLREQEHDLSWVARNAPAILRGRYRDRRGTNGNDAVYAELWAKYDEEEKLKHG